MEREHLPPKNVWVYLSVCFCELSPGQKEEMPWTFTGEGISHIAMFEIGSLPKYTFMSRAFPMLVYLMSSQV